MSVFFTKRGKIIKPALVTITGTGNASYCYVTINGTKYNASASGIEVMPGDVIRFGVRGYSSAYNGTVTIDGAQVVSVTNTTTKTYDWTVPEEVSEITISLSYQSSRTLGRITVTTS